MATIARFTILSPFFFLGKKTAKKARITGDSRGRGEGDGNASRIHHGGSPFGTQVGARICTTRVLRSIPRNRGEKMRNI